MKRVPRMLRRWRFETIRSMGPIVAAIATGTVIPYFRDGSAPVVAEVGVLPMLVGLSVLIVIQSWAIASEVL